MVDPQLIELGALEGTYRIGRQTGRLFLFLFTLAVVGVIFWLVRFVDAPLCIPVPLFAAGWVYLEFFIRRRTELRMFENGLIYRRLFREHLVFWDEIEEFGHVLRSDYETTDLRDKDGNPIPKVRSGRGGGDQVWLQTHDGEKFYLRPDLEDMKAIIDKISTKLWGEPYYGAGEFGEDYTSRIIRSEEIDA